MSRFKLSFALYSARNFPPLQPVLERLAEIGTTRSSRSCRITATIRRRSGG